MDQSEGVRPAPTPRSAPPAPVRVAVDYFGVTFVVVALVAGAVAVGFGGDPAPTLLRFVLGVAAGGGGLFAAMGHLVVGDSTAEDMGWPVGTPWQREVGFADLALGVICLIAAFSRDRAVWTLAVVAISVFLVGDAVGHVVYRRAQMARGHAAPPGAKAAVGDLVLPVTLVVLLLLT